MPHGAPGSSRAEVAAFAPAGSDRPPFATGDPAAGAQAAPGLAPEAGGDGLLADSAAPAAEPGPPLMSGAAQAHGPGLRPDAPARPEASVPHHATAPPASPQPADAIVRTRGEQVEIVLNPHELGRVTVRLGAEGDPGHLGLYVERAETAELFRRHSDQLLRDLRGNGMPEARLDLLQQDGQGQHHGAGHRRPAPLSPDTGAAAAIDRPAPPAPPMAPATRLDIRL